MDENPELPELVSTKAIAELIGVTQRRVQQLKKEGVIESVKIGRADRFELVRTLNRYIANLKEACPTTEEKSNEARKTAAEARYREIRADEAAIKLAELEGSMHSSEDVRAATEQLVYAVRSALLALPGRLAVDMAATTSASEASAMIRCEVEAILEELSHYRYDPDTYHEMVRKRNGMEAVSAEEPAAGDG